MKISQEANKQSDLKRFGIEKCKPPVTPLVENVSGGYEQMKDTSSDNTECYQQILGTLLYFALQTCSDGLWAVSSLVRFQLYRNECVIVQPSK